MSSVKPKVCAKVLVIHIFVDIGLHKKKEKEKKIGVTIIDSKLTKIMVIMQVWCFT